MAASLLGCQGEPPRETPRYSVEKFVNVAGLRGNSISHDDEMVLFSSDQSGVYNIYAAPLGKGEPVRLTDSETDSIYAISYFPHDRRALFRKAGSGTADSHLFVLHEDGRQQDLTPFPPALNSFLGWSRDGKSFYFESNRRDIKIFDFYEMDVASLEPKLLYRNDDGHLFGAVSDDHRFLALYHLHTEMDSDIYIYDTRNKLLKDLTPHQGKVFYKPLTFEVGSHNLYYLTDDGSEFNNLMHFDAADGRIGKVEEAEWDIVYALFSHSGKYRVIGINNDARTELRIYDTVSDKRVQLPELPEGQIHSVNFSRSEALMTFVVEGSRSPNDIFVFDLQSKELRQLTDSLHGEIDPDDLVDARRVRYESFDGLEIPALYYEPRNVDPEAKFPGLIWVHGGPGGQARIRFSPLIQYLVNYGYAVLAVNSRGSTGYGKTFFSLDKQRQGRDDLADCIEGKKFLISTGRIDPERIGIIGGSYGGYVVLAAMAFRPKEFDVGVNLFGISNWIHTLNSIPPWYETYREILFEKIGHPEKDAEYLREISPYFHSSRIQKPLLVLQGAGDPRVKREETDQMVENIESRGVFVKYIVFEDEGHGVRLRKNQIDLYRHIRRFLDHQLKEAVR